MWSWREDKRGIFLLACQPWLEVCGHPMLTIYLFPNVAFSENAALITALQDELQTLKAVSGLLACVRAC